MKKLKILKNILFVWYYLLIIFFGYCFYYLIDKRDTLTDSFVNLNIDKEFDKLRFSNIDEYTIFLQDKFAWSLFFLFIFYIVFFLSIFVFYFHFKNLYLFYVCNESSTGIVTYKDYRFYLEYFDESENSYKNHFSWNQKLYRKIYIKRNGEIDVFYDKHNPKNFVIGNKPTFLVEHFLKPFFLDLSIFILIFIGIYFAHPFLFLSVI